jgi:hypothetical protein
LKIHTLSSRLILWVQGIALLESYFSEIKVVSDGLHSQKQCIIIPSVGGSSSKQVYRFFICLRGVFDCVCGKVDARNSVQFAVFSLQKIVL